MNKHIYKRENSPIDYERAKMLRSHGLSYSQIAESMGISQGSVKRALDSNREANMEKRNAARRKAHANPTEIVKTRD